MSVRFYSPSSPSAHPRYQPVLGIQTTKIRVRMWLNQQGDERWCAAVLRNPLRTTTRAWRLCLSPRQFSSACHTRSKHAKLPVRMSSYTEGFFPPFFAGRVCGDSPIHIKNHTIYQAVAPSVWRTTTLGGGYGGPWRAHDSLFVIMKSATKNCTFVLG